MIGLVPAPAGGIRQYGSASVAGHGSRDLDLLGACVFRDTAACDKFVTHSERKGFRAMDVTKPYRIIGLGASCVGDDYFVPTPVVCYRLGPRLSYFHTFRFVEPETGAAPKGVEGQHFGDR